MIRPILIAECGNNHEGSMDAALQLVDAAAAAGADLIKFQAGTAEGFARRPADVERYRNYELGTLNYWKLVERGRLVGVPVFFSVWSPEFNGLRHLDYFKIASRQMYNQDLITRFDEATTFVSIPHTFAGALTIRHAIPMHCVSEYPAADPMLTKVWEWSNVFERPVGYSDHTIGIDACIEAVRHWNAIAIEKHFTLDHSFGPLRDHRLSATPQEFKRLVQEVKP